jgi:hypothetical protein
MDDAKVLQACRLLHEALCDDLELKDSWSKSTGIVCRLRFIRSVAAGKAK